MRCVSERMQKNVVMTRGIIIESVTICDRIYVRICREGKLRGCMVWYLPEGHPTRQCRWLDFETILAIDTIAPNCSCSVRSLVVNVEYLLVHYAQQDDRQGQQLLDEAST